MFDQNPSKDILLNPPTPRFLQLNECCSCLEVQIYYYYKSIIVLHFISGPPHSRKIICPPVWHLLVEMFDFKDK